MTSLRIPDSAQRTNLAAFVEHALRLDEAAVIRLRMRSDGMLSAWVATGFDVLACRVLVGAVSPPDVTFGADQLRHGLRSGGGDLDAGLPMDSAWRGALPPEAGFIHIDDVPAEVMARLVQRGAELAREYRGAHGPPASLMDQEVLTVSGGGSIVGVPMRCVLATAAMGFLPGDTAGADLVRVRATPMWLRIDARFGSVFRRRGARAQLIG